MKLVDKFKQYQKLKKTDIDETIQAIRNRMEKGPNPETQEYRDLDAKLSMKERDLEDAKKTIKKIDAQLNKFEAGTQVFRLLRQQRAIEVQRMEQLMDDIMIIHTKMDPPQPGTPEFNELRKQMEQELKNKKLVKEMRFMGLTMDKAIMIAVILLIAGFGFALDTDSPKALKIASFVLKLPICKV